MTEIGKTREQLIDELVEIRHRIAKLEVVDVKRRRAEEALKKRRLELKQRTNQLLALQKVTTSVQRTLELSEVLLQVSEAVVVNLGYDHSFVLTLDEKRNVFRGTTFFSKGGSELLGEVEQVISRTFTEVAFPLREGYSRVLDEAMYGKTTVAHDLYKIGEPLLTKDECDAVQQLLGAKTIVNVPIFARDRLVGSILAFTEREQITAAEVEPLRPLANQAGVAVENATLHRGAVELAQRLAVLGTLSRIVGTSVDIREVYRAFTDEIRRIIDFDRASIALVEGDMLRFFAVSSEVETDLGDGVTVPLAESATRWVMENKRTNIDPDFTQEMQFPIDEHHLKSGLRSAIRVPLFSKGEVFGTFNLTSRHPNAYGEREQEILEQVSIPLAASIENSRLFTQVNEHKAELERAYEDLKVAQDYMVQSERLRELGEMAGGVAHDFNNVLAVILGRVQLALEGLKDAKLKRTLQVIEQTALDAAKTVRRLQDFAKMQVDRTFEPVDLNRLVESALQMAEPRQVELEETVGITIEISAELGDIAPVAGEAAELREVLLNILFNAMDAMPQGGKITVKTEQKNSWVLLSISDTGIGIPEEVKGKVFDPFFTTRAPEGIGLGLSVTYGIVTRHGGRIKVESTEGEGATFYIKLPVSTDAAERARPGRKPPHTKRATILLVDDDPEVIEVLGLMLERLGHWVTGATSGEEALDAFKEVEYDLVITDLGMPKMSGLEVAQAVKEMKPGTPVMLITGWGIQLDQEELPGIDGAILKPFSKDALSAQIAELLPAKIRTAGRKDYWRKG